MTEILKAEYATLFRLETYHRFRFDSAGNRVEHKPDLLFKPTPECRKYLRNYRLLVKPTDEGFHILGQVKDANTSPPKLLIPIDEGVKFTFTISLLNPYFTNFSNLPIEDTREKLYRFTNLQENVGIDLSLSKSAGGYVSGADLVPIKPKRFTAEIDISPPVSQTQVLVKDRRNNVVIDKNVMLDMGTTSSKGVYNTYLTAFEDGIYIQTIDGVDDTFFSSDHCFTNSIFGVVEIFNGSEPPDAYKFINSAGEITPVTYVIPFAARSCIWKYYLVQRIHTVQNPNSITITHESGLSFSPESIQDYNQYLSQLPFHSDGEIELRCKDNNCTINFPESFEIPQPSYENIKIDGSNNYYVESFIYI